MKIRKWLVSVRRREPNFLSKNGNHDFLTYTSAGTFGAFKFTSKDSIDGIKASNLFTSHRFSLQYVCVSYTFVRKNVRYQFICC